MRVRRVPFLPFCASLVACSGASSAPPSSVDDTGAPIDASVADTESPADSSVVDAGTDDTAIAADTSSSDANAPCPGGCRTGQMCVTITTSGGTCQFPPEAGGCPSGYEKAGNCCVRVTTTGSCRAVPSSCGGAPTCASCGNDLCGACACASASFNAASCTCAAP